MSVLFSAKRSKIVYDMDEEKKVDEEKVPEITDPDQIIETKVIDKNKSSIMTEPDLSKDEFDVESQSSSIDLPGKKNFKMDDSMSQSENEMIKEQVENILKGVTTRQKYEFIEDQNIENIYGWNLISPGVLEIINPGSEVVTIKRNVDGRLANFDDKVEGPKEVPFLTVEDNVMAVKFIVQYDSERMLPETRENGENSKVEEIVEIPKEKSFTSIQTEQVAKKSFKKYFNFKKWKKRKNVDSVQNEKPKGKPWFGFWF